MADEEDNWRFAVEDVGNADEGSESGSNAQGASANPGEPDAADERPPLEPGSPTLENALFVLLGVFVTLLVVVRVATLLG